jgi:hypothetical protein
MGQSIPFIFGGALAFLTSIGVFILFSIRPNFEFQDKINGIGHGRVGLCRIGLSINATKL